MIAITAATGQLGRLIVEQILHKVPASQIVAVVRNPNKAADLAALGITVRAADYDDPVALGRAFTGVSKVLLISGMDFGRRVQQHANVIGAAKQVGAALIAYTSLLRADTSPLNLGPDHSATETILRQSGVPFVILRNGWYHENYTASIPSALAHGTFVGSAGDGRIASAARADYAAAAVVALTGGAIPGTTYELAGDTSYTLTEFAAEVSRQASRAIPYTNLPENEFAGILLQAGLPPPLAHGLASWDAGASTGALFDESHALSRLIGRPTTPVSEAIARALAAIPAPTAHA